MTNAIDVPTFETVEFKLKQTKYCLCIPIINEGERFLTQLKKIVPYMDKVDVIICDGGSNDGSTAHDTLSRLGIKTLLVKTGPGKLSAQLRMGYWYALEQGYEGIITVDGNGKDNADAIPLFMAALDGGYDYVQGSRYIKGGKAINTPKRRHYANKYFHAPVLSLAAGFRYTDTTNGYRAYSKKYLQDARVQPFRSIFNTYELLAYLTVRANQIGLKTKEVPVTRSYPANGKVPTKISLIKGNSDLLKILVQAATGRFNP